MAADLSLLVVVLQPAEVPGAASSCCMRGLGGHTCRYVEKQHELDYGWLCVAMNAAGRLHFIMHQSTRIRCTVAEVGRVVSQVHSTWHLGSGLQVGDSAQTLAGKLAAPQRRAG